MAEEGCLDQPAFVFGTARCGLTPLMDLVAYHPDFAWPSQYHFFYPNRLAMARLSRIVEWPLVRSRLKFKLLPYMPTHEEAWPFWRTLFRGFAEPFRDLTADDVTPQAAKRFRHAVKEIMRYQRKPRFIAEYSGWARIEYLREIFPRALFIHIVRDPRAVVNSLTNIYYWKGYEGTNNWRWGDPGPELREALERYDHSFLALAAVQWRMLIANILEKSESLPEKDRMLVRYEDLVADPFAKARQCVEFLGADPTDRRFERHLRTTRIVDANQETFRIPSWRENMTPKQIAMLEDLLSEELEFFGYA